MLTIPDLLNHEPRLEIDRELIAELLEMAFLGRDSSDEIDAALAAAETGEGWRPEFFANDLFVHELVAGCFPVVIRGRTFATHRRFLERILAAPPQDLESVRFRQGIVVELEENAEVRGAFEALYESLYELLDRLRRPGHVARLDINTYRLEVLKHCKQVIDAMVSGFADASSGIRRLHEVGREVQDSPEYRLLDSLVDYERRMARIRVGVHVGASGRITDVDVEEVQENADNLFYMGPWRRLRQRLSFMIRGYKWDSGSVLARLVHQVFIRLTPSLTPLVQLLGHLEIYLANRGFRRVAAEAGLEVTLARLDGERVEMRGLFNPLLLRKGSPPVPCDLAPRDAFSITLVTGPNSGGKTRLLQAVGLAQVLGQGGFYAPAERADLVLVRGLFVSLIQQETADQAEGRLGRELVRIRTMFDGIRTPALVILDELCSGTNPSEGIEVFSLVLRLLERLGPLAFISTHFLDFARELEGAPIVAGLTFLQVEVDAEQSSTYQFVEGVAETSLAALMAERLGVTYEELSAVVERRLRESG
jgi:DNA mismatch repair protein MutS2